MEVRELCVFSPSGDHLAVCGLEGEVKVWEWASGKLGQRFSPQGGRAGPAKCMAWSRPQDPHKHKKRKRVSHELLALAVGSEVVVWNITKGEEYTVLTGVHSDVVNSVSWSRNCLYSGSSDQHVVEWNIENGTCASKWKADRRSVQCVSCPLEGSLLLTAGRSIKLWSLHDHSLIKVAAVVILWPMRFTGHATSVRQLSFLDDSLFLSCAENDRVVNIWRVDGSHGNTSAASLTCEEEVTSFDITHSEQSLRVAVISVEGALHLFSFPLTNQITAPVSAHCTIQFVSTATKGDTPSPLPVLAAKVSSSEVALAHSNSLRPSFETIDFNQSEKRVCLVREDRSGLLLGKRKHKEEPSPRQPSVTVLGPGHMSIPGEPLKARRESVRAGASAETSSTTKGVQKKGSRPSASSLAELLVQAVQSGDRSLMEEVLTEQRSKVITNTIRRLPLSTVIPFLRHLLYLLETNPGRGLELSLWMRCVLTSHTAYLMTVPDLLDSLSGLYQLLDARTALFPQLCQLQGKLSLLLAHGDQPVRGEGPVSTPTLSLSAGEDAGGAELWGGDDNMSEGEGTDQSDLEEPDQSDDSSSEGEELMEAENGELT